MMAEQVGSFPVVDFSSFNISHVAEIDLLDEKVQATVKNIWDAFRTKGFVYLKNHGLRKDEVEKINSLFRTFFALPLDVKEKYSMKGNNMVGYIALGMERATCDFREGYELRFNMKLWPNEDVPGFQSTFADFFQRTAILADRIMQAIAVGLKLKDPLNFFNAHHNLVPPDNGTLSFLKGVLYPPTAGEKLQPGQISCVEHTDACSIAMVFQDDVGGLQVQGSDGQYCPAPPIPGTVVVNIGNIMQQWTTDRLKAPEHRVVMPESAKCKRSSMIFFVLPNKDCVIECLDGSKKYPPVTFREWIKSSPVGLTLD